MLENVISGGGGLASLGHVVQYVETEGAATHMGRNMILQKLIFGG